MQEYDRHFAIRMISGIMTTADCNDSWVSECKYEYAYKL